MRRNRVVSIKETDYEQAMNEEAVYDMLVVPFDRFHHLVQVIMILFQQEHVPAWSADFVRVTDSKVSFVWDDLCGVCLSEPRAAGIQSQVVPFQLW